ncbi:MAG: PIN domain-containing protein [Gemmatimonadales bacterium]|nr:PIN domain-containing protein [Gemmatimonadales bacterium]
MAGRAFADTSGLLALAHRRDQYHARAAAFARKFLRSGGQFVSTPLVAAEVHGLLLYRLGADPARAALEALLADSAFDWVPVDSALIGTAVGGWLEQHRDQALTLCDVVSFEVMRRARLETAFAFDRHFEVAGYRLVG